MSNPNVPPSPKKSWWDTFKEQKSAEFEQVLGEEKVITGIAGAIGTAFGRTNRPLSTGIAGAEAAARGNKVTEKVLEDYEKIAAEKSRFGGAGLIGAPVVAGLTLAEEGWSYGFARPASTAMLLSRKPEYLGWDWNTARLAWNRSEKVSFGKASVGSPVVEASRFLFPGGQALNIADDLAAGEIEDYDPWSDYDLSMAEKNPIYNVVTGTTDASLAIFVPPAVKIARLAAMERLGLKTTIKSAADLARYRESFEEHTRFVSRLKDPKKQTQAKSGNAKIFDSFAKDAESAGVKIDDTRGGDFLASTVYQYRAKKLSEADEAVKTMPTTEGKVRLDFDDDYTYQKYMETFYPEVTEDTVITLYRGLKEGEDIFTTPGTGQANITAGMGSHWTTNPVVAKSFGAKTRVVSIDVRFGDLKNFEWSSSGKPRNTIIGPLDEAYGSEAAIILDYTKMPDSIKNSVKTFDFDLPEGTVNTYDGFAKLASNDLAAATSNTPLVNPSLPDVGRVKKTTYGQQVYDLSRETTQAKVRLHPLVANTENVDKDYLAKVIAETDDPNTVNNIILATRGDNLAVQELNAAAPDHIWQLADLNTVVRNSAINGESFMPIGNDLTRVNQVFDSALARDQYFNDLKTMFMSEDGFTRGAANFMPTSRFVVEKIRGARRKTEYAVKYADYSDAPRWIQVTSSSAFGRPATSFLQWVGSRKPLGIVSRSGARPNDLSEEFRAMMDSVPVLRGTRNVTVGLEDVDGNLVPTVIPASQFRQELFQKILNSENRGDLIDVWREVEDEVTRVISLTEGLDPAKVSLIVQGYRNKADETMNYMRSSGGFVLDEKGTRILLDPISRRQFVDSFSVTPMAEIYNYVRAEGSSLVRGGLFVQETSTSLFDAGMKLFRTDVLFRPGYTGKNSILEPLVSSWLAHGTVLADDGPFSTMGRFVGNRVNNVKAAVYRTELNTVFKKALGNSDAKTKKSMARELNALVQQRNERQIVIDNLLAEIDDIKNARVSPGTMSERQAEAYSRLQDARLQMDAIESALDGNAPEWRQVLEPLRFSDVSQKLREYKYITGEDTTYADELLEELGSIYAQFPEGQVLGVAATARINKIESIYTRITAQYDNVEEIKNDVVRMQAIYDDVVNTTRYREKPQYVVIQENEKTIEAIDRKISSLQTKMGASREKLDEVSGLRGFKGSGQDYMTVNVGGEKLQIPAAFSDRGYDFGSGYRAEASAAMTSRSTWDPSYRASQEVAYWRRSGQISEILPTDSIYWDELAYVANAHFRGDKLIQRILEGDSDVAIARWLATSEGRAYQKSMGTEYLKPKEIYVQPKSGIATVDGAPVRDTRRVIQESTNELLETIRIVKQYFPDEKTRQLVAAGEVTPGQLQKLMGGRGDLSRIAGDTLEYVPGSPWNRAMTALNSGMDRVWQFIATMPEDRIARWPFYQREFKMQMQRMIDIQTSQGATVTVESAGAMRQAAHRMTLNELEKTFYNIRRYNNFVYTSRFLMSFPGAFFNSIYRYGRFAAKEPERFFQTALIANEAMTTIAVDKEGNKVDNLMDGEYLLIPGTKQKETDTGLRVPLTFLSSIAVGSPSLSYAGNALVSTVVANNPANDERLRSILGEQGYEVLFPYGITKNPLDVFLSSYQKDAKRLIGGMGNDDFLQAATQIHADNLALWEKGGALEDDRPDFNQAVSETEAFFATRVALKFVDSFGTRYEVPGQLMRDSWIKTKEQYPEDSDEARKVFLEKYGDWAEWYTYSTSSYQAYLPSTQLAYERVWVNNPSLTKKLVALDPQDLEMISLMAVGTDGTFSPAVYNYMRENPLPGDSVPVTNKMTPEAFENARLVNRGWDYYSSAKARYDAEIVRLRSLRDVSPSDDVKNVYREQILNEENSFKEFVAQYSEYNKPWAAAKTSRTDRSVKAAVYLKEILNDKSFMKDVSKDPTWTYISAFIQSRDAALKAVSEEKDSDLKKEIKINFSNFVEQNYSKEDSVFDGVWERYFASEWEVE